MSFLHYVISLLTPKLLGLALLLGATTVTSFPAAASSASNFSNCETSWEGDAIVQLKGHWCAQWQNKQGLLPVPGLWLGKTIGGAEIPAETTVIFQHRVLHPNVEKGSVLQLRLPRPYDAYHVEINGQTVVATGEFSDTNKRERYPHYVNLLAKNNHTDIKVTLNNQRFVAGGLREAPQFGYEAELNKKHIRALGIEAFQSGLLFLMAFVQFAQFIAYKKQNRAGLYFGFACVAVTIFAGTGGENWLVLAIAPYNFDLELHLRWFMVVFACLALAEFLCELFPKELAGPWQKYWRITCGLFVVSYLLLPDRSFAWAFWLMELLVVIVAAYLISGLIRAAWHKRPSARANLFVYGLLFAAISHDIFVDFIGLYLGNFGPPAVVLCMVWQGLSLAILNAQTYRRSEALVQQLQKAESVKDEFLANTSHELRTPLQAIIGLSESNTDSANRKENQKLIADTARRLALLVDDLIDLTRMRQQGIVLQQRELPIAEELSTLAALFKPVISHRNLQIELAIENKSLTVNADPRRLRQVLYNLVGNAVKFTDAGTITLYTQQAESGRLRIGVKDTGPGMNEQQVSIALARYGQAGGDLSGVGLGLAITQGILAAHQSELALESEVNKGTNVSFELSIGVNRVEPSSLVSVNTTTKTGKYNSNTSLEDGYILALDDDGSVLYTLEQLLKPMARQVLLESQVDHALSIIMQKTPALLILDLMMPSVSGFDVLSQLRERFNPVELPILVLSARQDDNDRYRALTLGANDYLVKPCEPLEFNRRVSAQLAVTESSVLKQRFNQATAEQEQLIAQMLEENRPFAVESDEGELLLANELGKEAWTHSRHCPDIRLPLQDGQIALLWPAQQDKTPREQLVSLLQSAVSIWLQSGAHKLSLIEQCQQWSMQLDGSTMRSRTFDRYTAEASLPKRPNVDKVLATARFVAAKLPAQSQNLEQSIADIEKLQQTERGAFNL